MISAAPQAVDIDPVVGFQAAYLIAKMPSPKFLLALSQLEPREV